MFRRASAGPQYLLIRDPYDNWGLPKGHIEKGETPQQTALREIAEETGLGDLVLVAELPSIDWFFRDHGSLIHKYCHFFLVESANGDPVPQLEEGITECIWRPLDIALQVVTYANAREVLRAAGACLTGVSPEPDPPATA